MDSDSLYLVASRLANSELEKLCQAGLWSHVRTFAQQQFWWYLRTCHLFHTELQPRPGLDWRQAYPYLASAVAALGL